MFKKLHLFSLFLAFLLLFAGCVNLRVQQGTPIVSAPPPTAAPATLPPSATQPVTEAPTGNAAAATWSKTEIVSFFNTAYVNVQNSQQRYLLKNTVNHTASLVHCSSAELESMAQQVIAVLNREIENEYTVDAATAAAADGSSVPIAELLPNGSTGVPLKETDVTAARASFDGENVVVVLNLVDVVHDNANYADAALVPRLGFYGRDISPYTVHESTIDYTDITLAAGIDGQGRLVTVTVTATAAGSAVGGIGVMTAEVLFAGKLKESRTFVY